MPGNQGLPTSRLSLGFEIRLCLDTGSVRCCVVRLVTNLSESQNIDNHISTPHRVVRSRGMDLSPHSKQSVFAPFIDELYLETPTAKVQLQQKNRPHWWNLLATLNHAGFPKCSPWGIQELQDTAGSQQSVLRWPFCAVRIIYQNQAMRTGWDPTVTWSNSRQISFELWRSIT